MMNLTIYRNVPMQAICGSESDKYSLVLHTIFYPCLSKLHEILAINEAINQITRN